MPTSFGKAFGQQGRLDGELISGTDGTVYAYSDLDFAVIAGGQERFRVKADGTVTSGIQTFAPQPSGDNTGITDTANIQAAIDATPSGGTLNLAPGTYKIASSLNITKAISLRGNTLGPSTSPPEGVWLTAVTGATGPIVNISPGATIHSISVANISIDLSAATGIVGFYFKNIDNSTCSGLFVRDGDCGFQLDGIAYVTFRDCIAFNQRTRGYYSSAASNVDIRFHNCQYSQTVGATWAATSAWDIAQGASFILDSCEQIRSIAGSGNWLSYGLNVSTPAATAWIFIVNSWFDAASDGTGANSANSAAALFTNSVNVRASNSFFSANTSAPQKQRAMRINGGSDMQFTNCTFGGSLIEFATGNADRVGFSNDNFVQAFSDPAITFTGGAAPTNGSFKNNTLGVVGAGIVASAADATTFHNWTKGANTDA